MPTEIWGTFRSFYMRINIAPNGDLHQRIQILANISLQGKKCHLCNFYTVAV